MVNLFVAAKDSFTVANPRLVFNSSCCLLHRAFSFAVANHFAAAKVHEQTDVDHQLPLNLISSITLLDFPSNLAKIRKWKIIAFIRDNGVNLAFSCINT